MNIDLLIFVEIKKREYKVSKILESQLIRKGYSVKIQSIFNIGLEVLKYRPKMILIPYATSEKDRFIRFIKSSFNCTIVSLNYEQILNKSNAEYRRPDSKYLKEEVFHISWDQNYTNYLNDSGVKNEHIVNLPKINLIQYQASKKELSQYKNTYVSKFCLNKFNNVFFYPLNFNWAFKSDSEVREKIKYGYDSELAWSYRENSKFILNMFLNNLLETARTDHEIFHLVRPHPGIDEEQYYKKLSKIAKNGIPDNIKISGFGDVFEWVNIANIIISNWSTVLYDANQLGYQTFQFGSKFYDNDLELPIFEGVPQLEDLSKIKSHSEEIKGVKNNNEILEQYEIFLIEFLKLSNQSSVPKVRGIAINLYFSLRKYYLAFTAALGKEHNLNAERF